MKLLLDEMLSPEIADRLRERGHDAQAIATSEHVALSDSEILDLARTQQRAVVTNNVRDFRPLHVAAVQPGGAGHFGMIFVPSGFRRTTADIGRIVAALEAKLDAYPGPRDLADGEDWL